MLKRMGVIWIILGSFFYTLPVQASRIGAYMKGHIMGGDQDKTGIRDRIIRPWSDIAKTSFAGGVSFGYQQHRYEIFEIDLLFASKEAVLRYSAVGIWKKVFPIRHDLNLYFHFGSAFKMENSAKIPFGGIGFTTYFNRKVFLDVAWRYYRVPDLNWWKKGETSRSINSGVISIGYYFN